MAGVDLILGEENHDPQKEKRVTADLLRSIEVALGHLKNMEKVFIYQVKMHKLMMAKQQFSCEIEEIDLIP